MATDPRVTKRRVTMRNVRAAIDPETGKAGILEEKVVDYVRPDFLDAYVADAKTRWMHVEVSDEPDAGPGGYDGETYVPETLDHPLAGQTFAATTKEG